MFCLQAGLVTDAIDRAKDDIRLFDQPIQRFQRLFLAAVVMQETGSTSLGTRSEVRKEMATATNIEELTAIKANRSMIIFLISSTRTLWRQSRRFKIGHRIKQGAKPLGLFLKGSNARPGGTKPAFAATEIV